MERGWLEDKSVKQVASFGPDLAKKQINYTYRRYSRSYIGINVVSLEPGFTTDLAHSFVQMVTQHFSLKFH